MRNIIFFGSSPFSVIVLEKLLSAQCSVLGVITTPDRPAGRHLRLTPNPVKVFAFKHSISVLSDADLPAFLTQACAANASTPPSRKKAQVESPVIGLVAAYGQIIPQAILDKFNNQIYNIHPSLLPKYRGPSPLQQQILDGITDSGVTLFQLDSQMDHGLIVAQQKDIVLPDDTWITLGHRLFEKGANLFIEKLTTHNLQPPTTQDDSLATYTHKLTRQSGFIPWKNFNQQLKTNNSQLERKFRAFATWPGVWTIDPDGRRLKLIALSPPTIQHAGQKPIPVINQFTSR